MSKRKFVQGAYTLAADITDLDAYYQEHKTTIDEIIKWAGRSESSLVKIVSAPGLCLQKITTAEPDESQIEAAIAAMKGVLEDEPE